MPKITFVTLDKGPIDVAGKSGETLMQAAVSACVPGIDADCGGALSCATCHVHIASEWMTRIGPPGDVERQMLEFDGNVTDASRLSCQIKLDEALDGLVVEVVDR
ncbi:MAG: 2Fe-2S ferredoxin [Hydrocarboniphaga sp.]|uniref:2Fe-2S iron-sulfur cluster-binding protein n=1 Tax=Hydrocarboniphaga sp. TaxID=2033016 RepID=UPI0026256B47|nr:2Fe-2S iron-sulfur cluster-binding protein [Hydrocarboniphaga sp.]MDB5972309.1 2Fe-2S ferredoxin [Hydrocarboniphaga sp.]